VRRRTRQGSGAVNGSLLVLILDVPLSAPAGRHSTSLLEVNRGFSFVGWVQLF
jgi:hypothetical protein